jgi:hypothetical protein
VEPAASEIAADVANSTSPIRPCRFDVANFDPMRRSIHDQGKDASGLIRSMRGALSAMGLGIARPCMRD